MKRCPECGSIVREEAASCSVCGASLLDIPQQALEAAVEEEEKAGAVSIAESEKKDRRSVRRYLLVWTLVYVATGATLLSGFLLLLYSAPSPLSKPFTPFGTGFILIVIGFLLLLYMVIGGGPSEGCLGWRRPRMPTEDSWSPEPPLEKKMKRLRYLVNSSLQAE